MTAYSKKKPHIYAYRRRKMALLHIQKLNKIVEASSKKDVSRLLSPVNDLFWKMEEKLGFFDGIPKRGERMETLYDKKWKAGLLRDVTPIMQYVCPICRRPGFQFSPNLDLEGRELERYMLHVDWPSKKTEFCRISGVKTDLIQISSCPIEGILIIR
jgi:hypothetical protein